MPFHAVTIEPYQQMSKYTMIDQETLHVAMMDVTAQESVFLFL